MELVRLNPWREVSNTCNRANTLFDSLFYPAGGRADTTDAWNWNPVVDVYENEDHFVIKAEIPGIDRKDIGLDVKGRALTLKGERRVDEDLKQENAHCRERVYGRFERAFTLPSHVDIEKITADYKEGVLRIEIPKPEMAKPKQITIQ
jgi:HSP20 family protein